MKYLIFDSGPLINLSMNGLLDILEKLKEKYKIEFLITKEVKREIIDVPEYIKQFELGALRLKSLFERGVIKHADLTNQEIDNLREIRENLMNIANSTFRTKKTSLHLIDKGESASLALSIIMGRKTNKEVKLVIDERTTRMLCENPENLRKLLEKKLHTTIESNKKNYEVFSNFKIIRSTELAYIAYKKKYIQLKGKRVLEAILYGLKFNGCSISEEEIQDIIRM